MFRSGSKSSRGNGASNTPGADQSTAHVATRADVDHQMLDASNEDPFQALTKATIRSNGSPHTGKGSLTNHADSHAVEDRDNAVDNMQSTVPERAYGEHLEPHLLNHIKEEDMDDHDHDDSLPNEDFAMDEASEPSPELLRALDTKPITTGQLIQEVKGIYSGLVMVERKCIEIVQQQNQNPTKLNKEQWQALIALHRTLLNEHHDFFAASHHPVTVGHELRELAGRYAMAARMWRHGIHGFLELLRNRLPDALEFMLSFIYLAYSMMTLLMETVPEFLETWIECLGDLARYRMAIEESDPRDREVWASTARLWYNKAADLSPNTGRVQHHLAVLARPFIVQQLFLYSKALTAAIPFRNAQESIVLLFNPLLEQAKSKVATRYQLADFNFVCAAGVLFKRGNIGEFQGYIKEHSVHFATQISRQGSRFKVTGPEVVGSLFNLLYDFGKEDNTLWNMLDDHAKALKAEYCKRHNIAVENLPKDFAVNGHDLIVPPRLKYWSRSIKDSSIQDIDLKPGESFTTSDSVTFYAGRALYQEIKQAADHVGDKNIVPFFHMTLAHLYALTYVPGAMVYIEKFMPWVSLVLFLNTVATSGISYDNVESPHFPKSYFEANKKQLPEDFVMRGLMLMTYYYPADFFDKEQLVDEDERLLEQAGHQIPRIERCLWAGVKLASLGRWIKYDKQTKQFEVTPFAMSLASDLSL